MLASEQINKIPTSHWKTQNVFPTMHFNLYIIFSTKILLKADFSALLAIILRYKKIQLYLMQ